LEELPMMLLLAAATRLPELLALLRGASHKIGVSRVIITIIVLQRCHLFSLKLFKYFSFLLLLLACCC
jgi:hypothetical protein